MGWTKFYVAALKDEKSYTDAAANSPKVKVTVKAKAGAKTTKKPAAKVTVKAKAGAKKDAKKPVAKVTVKAKAGANKATKKRRMQAAAAKTPAPANVEVDNTRSDVAGVAKVDVEKAPGQETPFDASAKLISLSFVTALLVAFM